MSRTGSGIFGLCAACLLSLGTLSGAEPVPSLALDFSDAGGGIIKDRSGVLSFKIGSDAKLKDNALVVTPGKDQFSVADMEAFRKWAAQKDTREISAAFWIRFDKSLFDGQKNTADFGLFSCSRDADGRISVTVHTKKTELLKPVVMTSRLQAENGQWYHVEFSYSMNSRRYALYVDGKFQTENDILLMPVAGIRDLNPDGTFRGAVKNFRFYEAALISEQLALSNASDAEFQALEKTADDILSAAKNNDLRNWVRSLKKQLAEARTQAGKQQLTIDAFKHIAKNVENTKALADGLASKPDALKDSPVTTYSVPVTSQDLYLPFDLPKSGELTKKIDVIMAQDEFESASVIVVPFRPMKQFTVRLTDLRNGSNVIKASDTDIKIVKRWYRTGGAWLTYHVDLYMRAFVPDMLLNDEKLVRVDENRRTNHVLFHYPGGDEYVDVSEFLYENEFMSKGIWQYFYDAPTLQPVEFKEAGRNRQYVITFHAAKDTAPGFYTGKLQLLADGRNAGEMDVTVRVLPFTLPAPATYYDVNKPYLSHVNSWPGDKASLKNGMDHNLMNLNCVANNGRNIRICKEMGYPLQEIFSEVVPISVQRMEFGGPEDKMTPELRAQMDRMLVNPILRWQKMFEKYTGIKDYTVWHCNSSESGWYGTISRKPDHKADVLHEKTHVKLFSHGMGESIRDFSPGIYTMNSSSYLDANETKIWHSFGGKHINYAEPFPGPENPGLMRRAMGLEMYKAYGMDGHMMHGYVGLQLNEFTKYPGGDGDYRSFNLCYRAGDGVINKIAIIGYREAFDDVRYATLMKKQAQDALNTSKDELVKREAVRQLAWLERVDGKLKDMDDFRTQVQYRILTLQELIRTRGGK